MALNIFQYLKGLRIIPESSSSIDTAGEMEVLSGSSNKLNYHNGSSASPVVTETHASQGTNRLKNKDLEDSTSAIVDSTDVTKKIKFDAGGTTGTSTTISATQTADRTISLPDVSTTMAGTDATQTLTNKSLVDNTTFIIDNSDNTKKLQFDVSSITTATTRTLTPPDITDILVTKSSDDTGSGRLQNKELSHNNCAFVDGVDTTKKIKFDASANTTGVTTTLATQSTTNETITIPSGNILTNSSTNQGAGRVRNKDLDDDNVFFVDSGDNTKKIKFESGAQTTGVTTIIRANSTAGRTFDLPDLSDTIITRTSTDQATNRIKNKDLESDSTRFIDATVNSKILKIDQTSQGSLSTTTIRPLGSSNQTIDIPHNASGDTFVLQGVSQTIQNKVYDGGTASSTRAILVPQDTKSNLDTLSRVESSLVYANDQDKLYIDNGSTLLPIGSGSGFGVNFVGLNSSFLFLNTNDVDAETSVGNWAAYADAAGTSPVDMTGGSPNVTIARTTTVGEVLNGSASFKVTKGAANRQGEGVSVVANVPPGYRGKPASIVLPFKVISGSLVQNDLKVYIYDVTNSQIITPFNNDIIYTSTIKATFDIPDTCAQIRFGFHFASTSTTAVTFSFDDVFVGPQDASFGPAMNDFQLMSSGFVPLSSAFGTVTGATFYSRRVGDSLEVRGYWTNGTVAASEARLDLPSNLIIDTSKFSSQTNRQIVGQWVLSTTGNSNISANNFLGPLFYDGSDNNSLYFAAQVSSGTLEKDNGNDVGTTGNTTMVNFIIPISGWSTSVINSNSNTFRISNLLANGTRVTGTAPTQLGEYRSYLRNASALTYTETNGAPTASPSSADGVKLYNGNGYSSADTNNEPSKYDIFIGKNKSLRWEFYRAAGRTSFATVDRWIDGTTSYGAGYSYDPTTGIATIYVGVSFAATIQGGISHDENGAPSTADIFFDIIVSESILPVQSESNRSEIHLDSGNGHGSTNTKVRRWSNIRKQIGNITYTDSSTLGGYFTINEDGIYSITYTDSRGGSTASLGIVVNGSAGTTSVSTPLTYAQGLRGGVVATTSNSEFEQANWTGILRKGDIVWAQDDGANDATTAASFFGIVKIGN